MKVHGAAIAGHGRSAAFSAHGAFAIPAPQVCLVQLHSLVCRSEEPDGTWQLGIVVSDETGNVTEPSFRRAINCGAVRLLLALTMSAAIPDTIGAEKLVPRLGLSWSV